MLHATAKAPLNAIVSFLNQVLQGAGQFSVSFEGLVPVYNCFPKRGGAGFTQNIKNTWPPLRPFL
jgi:hypothetical protein